MKLALVADLALVFFSCVSIIQGGITTPQQLFSDKYIQYINTQAKTWVAGRNFPENTTLGDLRRLLGVIKNPKEFLFDYKLPKKDIVNIVNSLPDFFDARQQWPNCKSISLIRSQSACGSCWAVSSASVISDRICIHSSDHQLQTQISAEDLMTCCGYCGNGCQGGNVQGAFHYWEDSGIVSGGGFGTGVGCKPYPFPECDIKMKIKYPVCPDIVYPVGSCEHECTNKNINYNNDIHRASSVYMLANDTEQIQYEIMKHGPVVATLTVYDDFYYYKSGVYHATVKNKENYALHAVRLIGWGLESNEKNNTTPYWLAANSWNDDWGDNGLFKILRGSNECDIEDSIFAGIPSEK